MEAPRRSPWHFPRGVKRQIVAKRFARSASVDNGFIERDLLPSSKLRALLPALEKSPKSAVEKPGSADHTLSSYEIIAGDALLQRILADVGLGNEFDASATALSQRRRRRRVAAELRPSWSPGVEFLGYLRVKGLTYAEFRSMEGVFGQAERFARRTASRLRQMELHGTLRKECIIRTVLQKQDREPKLQSKRPQKAVLPPSKVEHGMFDTHWSRPTPKVLEPGSESSIAELRRELEVSRQGLEELDRLVRRDVLWITDNVPGATEAQSGHESVCKGWATEKLWGHFATLCHRRRSAALRRWRSVCLHHRVETKVLAFLRVKGLRSMACQLNSWVLSRIGRCWERWANVVAHLVLLEQKAASTQINKIVRGFLAKCHVVQLRREKASVVIQCGARRKLAMGKVQKKKREILENAAAKGIQQRWACHLAKLQLRRLRENRAAVVIETIARRRLAKKRAEAQKLRRRQRKEILHLQRVWRGHCGRKDTENLRRQQRDAAAAKLQAVARSRRTRNRLRREAHEREERAAATAIQSITRQRKARRRVRAIKVSREANATKLQRVHRGQQARRRAKKIKEARDAATKVQSLLRKRHANEVAKRRRIARNAAMQQKREKSEAAVKIQAIHRGRAGRRKADRRAIHLEQRIAEQRRRFSSEDSESFRGERRPSVVENASASRAPSREKRLQRDDSGDNFTAPDQKAETLSRERRDTVYYDAPWYEPEPDASLPEGEVAQSDFDAALFSKHAAEAAKTAVMEETSKLAQLREEFLADTAQHRAEMRATLEKIELLAKPPTSTASPATETAAPPPQAHERDGAISQLQKQAEALKAAQDEALAQAAVLADTQRRLEEDFEKKAASLARSHAEALELAKRQAETTAEATAQSRLESLLNEKLEMVKAEFELRQRSLEEGRERTVADDFGRKEKTKKTTEVKKPAKEDGTTDQTDAVLQERLRQLEDLEKRLSEREKELDASLERKVVNEEDLQRRLAKIEDVEQRLLDREKALEAVGNTKSEQSEELEKRMRKIEELEKRLVQREESNNRQTESPSSVDEKTPEMAVTAPRGERTSSSEENEVVTQMAEKLKDLEAIEERFRALEEATKKVEEENQKALAEAEDRASRAEHLAREAAEAVASLSNQHTRSDPPAQDDEAPNPAQESDEAVDEGDKVVPVDLPLVVEEVESEVEGETSVEAKEAKPSKPGEGSSASASASVSVEESARTQETKDSAEWVRYWDDNVGTYYYFNVSTNEASWTLPTLASGVGDNTTEGSITDYDTDAHAYASDVESVTGTMSSTQNVPEWQECWDDVSNTKYWYNARTGEASWTDPNITSTMVASTAPKTGNPEDWVSYVDEGSGRAYWYNVTTGEASWADS